MTRVALAVTPMGEAIASVCRIELLDRFRSVRQAAAAMDLNYATLHRRLTGARAMTVGQFMAIAAALEMPPADLWREAEAFHEALQVTS